MRKTMCIDEVKTLSCSNSWRNYSFLKVTTQDGTVGWSEFDENFGSPGVSAVIDKISGRLIGKNAFNHEFLREDLIPSGVDNDLFHRLLGCAG